jgi:MFS family permease
MRRLLEQTGIPSNLEAARGLGVEARGAVIASLCDALGSGLWMPVTVIFLTSSRGLSAVDVGVGLSVAGAVSIACLPLSGVLIRSVGPGRLVVATYVLSALGSLAYLQVRSLVTLIVAGIVARASAEVSRPAKTEFLARLLSPGERVSTLALRASINNIGFGLGGLGAGVMLAVGTDAAFRAIVVADALSYLVAGAVFLRWAVDDKAARPPRVRSLPAYRNVLRDDRYVVVSLFNAVLMMQDSLLTVGLPLWLTRETHAPVALAGWLFALNTVLVIMLQVRLSHGAEDLARAARLYLRMAVMFAIASLAFVAAAHRPELVAVLLLVGGTTTMTFAEMWFSAGQWSVSIGLAPEHLRDYYLTVFSFGTALQRTFGPVVVTVALTALGGWGWILLAVALALAAAGSARASLTGVAPEARREPGSLVASP